MAERWSNGSLETLDGVFGHAEGPVWDAKHERLILSDVENSSRWGWTRAGGFTTIALGTGMGNGLALTPSGDLLVCEHATSRVVLERPDGTNPRELAASWQGHELNSPNDVIRAADGTVYFSDPSYGRRSARIGVVRDQELGFQGVFRIRPDGILELIARDIAQPNGLALRSDGSLIVADTQTSTLRICTNPDGPEPDWRFFAEVPTGGPDGLESAPDGHVMAATRDGVAVFDPTGSAVGVIPVPGRSTNLCWGPSGCLFITTTEAVHVWHL